MNRLIRAAFSSIFGLFAGGAALLVAGSLPAQPGPEQARAQKLPASAIQIERTEPPEDFVIPEDFRVATYENVILQVEKTRSFNTCIAAATAPPRTYDLAKKVAAVVNESF